MFYQIFLSPQVKRCAIITYKNGIYELPHELPHELPNDLRLTKYEQSVTWNDSTVPSLPSQNKSFANTSKKLLKSRN